MATALQQQLAAISAKSTNQLDLKAQKAQHSKSLLFEPRDAASQSFDTIYQLCLEGFEELCQLDSRFAPFARNLFSEQSKSEDRTQMTAKENAHLDSIVVRFLGLVAGRLLLKPATKATEWLIRRFKVHEYNTESVLLTFLPYHQSQIFTALLSIIPEQLPANFRFLHPYVASLQCPPRHAIVAAASSNSNFLTTLSQYVMDVAKARHHSAILLGFWASVTAQAVNGMIDASRSGRDAIRRQREEDVLLKVLPVLQDAMSVKGVPELYLGSCMIMTVLATKSTLSDKVLDAMMEAVAAGWTEQTIDEGVICLAVLAEERENMDMFPQPVAHALLTQTDALSAIRQVATEYRVRKLLVGTSLCIIKDQKRDAAISDFLTWTLEMDSLSGEDKIDVLHALLKEAGPENSKGVKPDLLQVVSSLGEEQQGSQLIRTAAQRAAIDLTELDFRLGLSLASTPSDVALEDTQSMDLDEEENAVEIPAQLTFTDLPKLSGRETSFLAPSHDDLFDKFSAHFREAIGSSASVAAFLDLISATQASFLDTPTALSFLARVWSCDTNPRARTKALRITSQLFEGVQKGKPIDTQALFPYVLSALADSAKTVRSAAAVVCTAMETLFEVGLQDSTALSRCKVWGESTIYGTTSPKLHSLTTVEFQKLLSDIINPVLEDCIIDGEFIFTVVADTINGTASSNRTNKKELKLASKNAIFAYLASHVVTTPLENVQLCLLSILSKVGKAAGPARVQTLLPFVRTYIEQPATKSPVNMSLCKALAGCVTHRSTLEIQFLKDLASSRIAPASVSKLGFDRLQRLWSAMAEPTQMSVVDWLMNMTLQDDVLDDVRSDAAETLQRLPLSTSVAVHLIESLPTVQEVHGLLTPAKRQRTSRMSDTQRFGDIEKKKLGIAVRRITTVLELIEASKPERHPQLLKGLFHLLSELHHYKISMDSELVYLQALLVNSLLFVVNGLKASPNADIDRSVIRPDLIVDCVRTTSSTQVHQSALLLMSALASWTPDLVLHSVMPLFTFMSSTILKQGDDYSAHVTDQTVSRIIPPLAASLKKGGRDLVTGAADLLLSFTVAFEHIPLHRRSRLFGHLVQTLGPAEALYAIMAMLIERYSDNDTVRPFVASLMDHFPVVVQLTAVRQYLDLVFDTLKPKRVLADAILGFADKDKEQATKATSTLLDGLADILAREGLRKKLSKELKTDVDGVNTLRAIYSVVLERTMQLGLQLKSNQALRSDADSLLTSVLSLMPSKDFIDSSAKLMQTGSEEIRQQVFRSLERRVQTAKRGDAVLQQVFIDVLPNCAVFLSASHPVNTRLAAVACMDRIAEKFGKTDRAAVMQAAEQIVGSAALGSTDSGLRRMSLLCLASMVEVLEDEFISILPQTLEKVLAYLRETLDSNDPDQSLLAACFSFSTALLDHVSWMLIGTYLDQLLRFAADADDEHARQFSELAARKVAPHEIISSIDRVWEDIIELGVDAMRLHLTTLRTVIQHHPKSTVANNAQSIFSVLLKAFDIRRVLTIDGVDGDDLDEVGGLVNDTTMDVVLKLNDATFRPFFSRLSEWSASHLPGQEKRGRILRKISFYSFVLIFFDQLKSLVTTYISYTLDDMTTIVKTGYNDGGSTIDLLNLVVQSLCNNFSQDQDGFWQSPAHFDIIAEPLVNLLQQDGVTGVEKNVIDAVVELASAANAPEHHKTIDDKLLTLMRHEEASVRLAAVKAERSLTERLSFDWCNFIPVWLPFIAELQEDDDGTVERETLRWMEQIQGVTGESVNEMLR